MPSSSYHNHNKKKAPPNCVTLTYKFSRFFRIIVTSQQYHEKSVFFLLQNLTTIYIYIYRSSTCACINYYIYIHLTNIASQCAPDTNLHMLYSIHELYIIYSERDKPFLIRVSKTIQQLASARHFDTRVRVSACIQLCVLCIIVRQRYTTVY